MEIEEEARQDLLVDDEAAEGIAGGRKTAKHAVSHTNSTVATSTSSVPAAPETNVPNTPLPISPFGDDCIPAEDATPPGSST